MYIKNNKIKLATNINEIPANDIKIADHVMIIEDFKTKSSWFNNIEQVEGIMSMGLLEISHENVYTFECVGTYSDYNTEEEYMEDCDDYKVIIKSKGMEIEKSYRTYFKTNKDKLMLLSDGDMHTYEISLRENELMKQIHERIFDINDKVSNFQKVFLEKNENRYVVIHYFKLRIDDDKYIVFTIKHKFNFKKRSWSVNKNVNLFLRQSDVVYRFDVDFNEVFENFKENYNNVSFKVLEDMLKISEYEIQDYISEEKEKREKDLFELFFYFHDESAGLYYKICKLFEPIFIDKDRNLKIYANLLKDCNIYCGNNITINDKRITGLINEDEKLRNQIRVANAIAGFFYNNEQCGVNPKDGLLYENGKVDLETMESKKYYKDEEMVDYSYKSYDEFSRYNIKIEDHYVQVSRHNESDQEKIKEYKDRRLVMDLLSAD